MNGPQVRTPDHPPTEPVSAGLSEAQAARVRRTAGPNAIRSHRTRALVVLLRQLRSPLLALLVVAAGVSFFVAERTAAVVIALS